MNLRMLLLPMTALTLLACTSSTPTPDPEPKETEVTETKETNETMEAAAAAKTVALAEQGCVKWVGTKKTGKHDGGFGKCTGNLMFDKDNNLVGVEVTVDINSIFSDNEMLTGHLKTPEFFDAATHATASFKSSSVKAMGEGKYEITGEFDIRGIKKTQTLEATTATTGDDWTGDAKMTLMRTDHAISYVGKEDDPIANEVAVMINLKASMAAAPAKEAMKEEAAPAPTN